jgi:hypothetical protein
MGTMVGGLILLVNGLTIEQSLGGLPTLLGWSLFAVIIVGTAVVSWRAWQREKRERAAAIAEVQALAEV